MTNTKPFQISKWLMRDAWKRVRANGGACGVDKVSIEAFEENLERNLYKIWNRMSSGSYFPPPVKRVEIPKDNGTVRNLGVPAVGDRVAQMVAKMTLEPLIEPKFHVDSYGYRPGKSAIEAVKVTRERCWKYDWVVDLDIKGFFDNIDHELMMKAVDKHTNCPWLRLYIVRWLETPVELSDGQLQKRTRGTPQGGVISPLLSNLFLHYVFDKWLDKHNAGVPFARFADDAVLHCRTRLGAQKLLKDLRQRFSDCKLELHPEKTKIVYCKDSRRRGNFEQVSFNFLGYCFRPRKTVDKKKVAFTGFLPDLSQNALKKISTMVRAWQIQKWVGSSIIDVANRINPVIRGWYAYYSHFGRVNLSRIAYMLNSALFRWAKKKFKKCTSLRQSRLFVKRLYFRYPGLFVHWRYSRMLAEQ